MGSCFLCTSLQSLQSNRSMIAFTTKEEAQRHASQHYQQTRIFDEDCYSLDLVSEQCFPNFAGLPSVARKKAVKSSGRQSLLDLCHTLFEGRVSKASPRVTCQKCGAGIDLYDNKQKSNLQSAIGHASAHLGIDLFECRKCGRSFRSSGAIRLHLKRAHGLRGLEVYFTDKSAEFIVEITASIKQCFLERNGSSDSRTPMIRLKSASSVQAKTKGSKLAVERQLSCYQLMTRQLVGEVAKVQCRLCPKRISCKQEGGLRTAHVMEHALLHLNKPLYRCKICIDVLNSRVIMHNHLKSKHALTFPGNYESLADKYHDEIMNVLRDCYADESGK